MSMWELTLKSKFKIVTAVILAILLIVVILQNTDLVETRLLFATVEMPRAAMLALAMLVGFVIGVLVVLSMGRRKSKSGGSADQS